MLSLQIFAECRKTVLLILQPFSLETPKKLHAVGLTMSSWADNVFLGGLKAVLPCWINTGKWRRTRRYQADPFKVCRHEN